MCFADESSTNILVSGSDDGYVKVWDRRSLSSQTPSGVLVGATEGITYTAPKGDGRYIVVNSKDQAARLYDLRKMRSHSEFDGEPDAVARYGQPRFDCKSSPHLSSFSLPGARATGREDIALTEVQTATCDTPRRSDLPTPKTARS